MGQMTFAVILGCAMPKAPKGKTWWGESEEVGEEHVYKDGIFDRYESVPESKRVRTDEDDKVLGFSVAVGASGEDDVPCLEGPIDLAAFESVKRYAKSLKRARATWDRFAAFCLTEGITLPEPRLWLVEFEVA